MRKIATALVCSAALIGAQGAAAQHIAPQAPWVFEGEVEVYKGIELTCNATVTINGPNSGGTTDVEDLSATITLSGGFLNLCNSVNVDPIPAGNVTYSGGTFTLHDVYVTTITPGDCEGDITAVWNDTNDTLSVSGVLPAVSGSDCTMDGVVDLTSPSSGTVVG